MSDLLTNLPTIIASIFMCSTAIIILALCVARIVKDDLSDGIPGDVPQLLVTGSVTILLLAAILGVPGALTMMKESAGAVAAIIPLSLSPWLIYKGYKTNVTKDNSQVEISKE